MMKIILLAIVALSAVNALSFDQLKKFKHGVDLVKQAGGVKLTSLEEEMTEMCTVVSTLDNYSEDDCINSPHTEDTWCNCTTPLVQKLQPMMKDMFCKTGACGAVYQSFYEPGELSESEMSSQCAEVDCLTNVKDYMEEFEAQIVSGTCEVVEDVYDEMENALEGNTYEFDETLMASDFYCSANPMNEDQTCAQLWNSTMQGFNHCEENFDTTNECLCPHVIGLGCCLKYAYEWDVHGPQEQYLSSCGFEDIHEHTGCTGSSGQQMNYTTSRFQFDSVNCGWGKLELAYQLQQGLSMQLNVDVSTMSVKITDCDCCTDEMPSGGIRRLLSTGSLSADVTIHGSDAESTTAHMRQVVGSDGFAVGDLGAPNTQTSVFGELKVQSGYLSKQNDAESSSSDDFNYAALFLGLGGAILVGATVGFFVYKHMNKPKSTQHAPAIDAEATSA